MPLLIELEKSNNASNTLVRVWSQIFLFRPAVHLPPGADQGLLDYSDKPSEIKYSAEVGGGARLAG